MQNRNFFDGFDQEILKAEKQLKPNAGFFDEEESTNIVNHKKQDIPTNQNFFEDENTCVVNKKEDNYSPNANFFEEESTNVVKKNEDHSQPNADFFEEERTNIAKRSQHQQSPNSNFFAVEKTNLAQRKVDDYQSNAQPNAGFFDEYETTNVVQRKNQDTSHNNNLVEDDKTNIVQRKNENASPNANFFSETTDSCNTDVVKRNSQRNTNNDYIQDDKTERVQRQNDSVNPNADFFEDCLEDSLHFRSTKQQWNPNNVLYQSSTLKQEKEKDSKVSTNRQNIQQRLDTIPERTIVDNPTRNSKNYIIVLEERNLLEQQIKNYEVNDKGAKIGRHDQNEIIITDPHVSRLHSSITFRNRQFLIEDHNSTLGTFIRVYEQQLKNGDIIEIGSHRFEILTDGIKCIEGSKKNIKYDINGSIIIGRKGTVDDIVIPEDGLISGYHASIQQNKQGFMIKDNNSVNGIWLKIDSIDLKEQDQIRISQNIHLRVVEIKEEENKIQGCQSCGDKIDAFVLPCKHKMYCMGCQKPSKKCLHCQGNVIQCIKIY